MAKICRACGAKQDKPLCAVCTRAKNHSKNRARGDAFAATHKATRAALLNAHPLCLICRDTATQADHLVPRAKGGDGSPANYIALCASCNSSKGAKTLAEFIRYRQRLALYVSPEAVRFSTQTRA